jgi:hypothetical protein
MNGMNRFIDLSVGNFVLVNGEWDARHERQTHMHISYLHDCAGGGRCTCALNFSSFLRTAKPKREKRQPNGKRVVHRAYKCEKRMKQYKKIWHLQLLRKK